MNHHHRHIIKYGALQSKLRKKGGTLLRKTKYLYEEEQWVALCVHNDAIPLLEWYPFCSEIANHEPTKVRDLLECQFVSVSIEDDRCFIIGFSDESRPVIEFAARTSEDARVWIDEIQSSLRRIGCMPAADNEYQPIPFGEDATQINVQESKFDIASTVSPTSIRRSPAIVNQRHYSLSEVIPLPTTTTSSILPIPIPHGKFISTNNNFGYTDLSPPSSPPAHLRPASFASSPPSRRLTKDSNVSSSIDEGPPRLPPRKTQVDLNSPIVVTPLSPKAISSELLGIGSSDTQYALPIMPSGKSAPPLISRHYHRVPATQDLVPTVPLRTTLQSPPLTEASSAVFTRFVFPSNSSSTTSGESNRLSQDFAQLRMSTTSSSTSTTTEDSAESTKSYPNESYQLIAPPRPKKISCTISNSSLNYAGTIREEAVATKSVSILLVICVEHLKLVEINGRIWVAGWSEEKNAALATLLNFGDQVVEINDTPVRSLAQLPSLFHSARPGIPIPFKIRTIPHGQTYTLVKPWNVYTPRTFGIILHKKKNMIDEVVPKSAAFKAGVPARIVPFLYGQTEVSSVITEVNGVPLNPFAKNDLFYKRMEQLPNGCEFQIVVHPKDFIGLLKEQLKMVNNTLLRRKLISHGC